jgi:anti-sigma factor RsiW
MWPILPATSPVDVVSSDRHTVKPWFQGKLPFSFNLPELAGSPFILLGGRLTYLNHEPGAQLIYNIGAHHISVFIFRDQPELAPAFHAQESLRDVLNFHVDSWSANELRYFVVGDASDESIRQLASLWKKAGEPRADEIAVGRAPALAGFAT